MKKKLLKTAAIASFLTAAGVVIPQTDIFAVDTPNTPHPSTLPSDKPSTIPNEQPSENTNSTENNGLVKEWHKIYDKKKVDSFAYQPNTFYDCLFDRILFINAKPNPTSAIIIAPI